jgi:hypothetical protein
MADTPANTTKNTTQKPPENPPPPPPPDSDGDEDDEIVNEEGDIHLRDKKKKPLIDVQLTGEYADDLRFLENHHAKGRAEKPPKRETIEWVLKVARAKVEGKEDVNLTKKDENKVPEPQPQQPPGIAAVAAGVPPSGLNAMMIDAMQTKYFAQMFKQEFDQRNIPEDQREGIIQQMLTSGRGTSGMPSIREMMEYRMLNKTMDDSGGQNPQMLITITNLQNEIARLKEGTAAKAIDPMLQATLARLEASNAALQEQIKKQAEDTKAALLERDRKSEMEAAEARHKAEMDELKSQMRTQSETFQEQMLAQNQAIQTALSDKREDELERLRREQDDAREAARIQAENESRQQYAQMLAADRQMMVDFMAKQMERQGQQLLAQQPAASSPADVMKRWKEEVSNYKSQYEEMQKIFGANPVSAAEAAKDSALDKLGERVTPLLGQLMGLAGAVAQGGQPQQQATPLPPGAVPHPQPNMVAQAQAQAIPPPVPRPAPRPAGAPATPPAAPLPPPLADIGQPFLNSITGELYAPPAVMQEVLADIKAHAPHIVPSIRFNETTKGTEMLVPASITRQAMDAITEAQRKRGEISAPAPAPEPEKPTPRRAPYRQPPSAVREKPPKPAPAPAPAPAPESTPAPPANTEEKKGE